MTEQANRLYWEVEGAKRDAELTRLRRIEAAARAWLAADHALGSAREAVPVGERCSRDPGVQRAEEARDDAEERLRAVLEEQG